MAGIDVKAYCVSRAMSVTREMFNQKAIGSTSDLETSWLVRVSQTRTREPVADQHANRLPLGEYSGQSIRM